MYVVVDTHALLWHLTKSSQLSPRAAIEMHMIEQGRNIAVIPAIVILECIDIAEKKKLDVSFSRVLHLLRSPSNYIMVDLDIDVVLETYEVKGINDLHDRAIIATARLYQAPIISRDKIIIDMYDRVIW